MKAKSAHILGAGKSGIAAANLLINHGWNVFLSDDCDDEKIRKLKNDLKSKEIELYLNGHIKALSQPADLVIVSPGLKPGSIAVESRKREGVEVIGELELGWRYSKGKFIAITGTNGKSTTTALLGKIFNLINDNSFACGNIGLPLSEIADQTDQNSLLSIELSSFQLVSIADFKPNISVIMCITPDHTDYHGGFENYKQAKALILSNQDTDDWVVYNTDDANVRSIVCNVRCQKFPFSTKKELSEGAFLKDDCLVVRSERQNSLSIPRENFSPIGAHNSANALAAMSAAILSGVRAPKIKKGISSFKGLPHRLEFVRNFNEIGIWNDSKCTNPDSGRVALEAFNAPIILVAGGKSKGDSYKPLFRLIKEKVRKIIVIGEVANQMESELRRATEIEHAGSLSESVEKAVAYAKKGDVILFSPLSASFDMFDNFEDRGNQFKKIIMGLK